jgi:YD repeat-containing protein
VSFPELHRAGFEYESQTGNVTRATDPLGRTTTYTYAPNGIDLLEVRQVNGQTTDLLTSYAYNSQHKPLTITDAAGATTSYTYNAQGQILTSTTPPPAGYPLGPTTSFVYDASGYLTSISGPVQSAAIVLRAGGNDPARPR